MALKQWFFKKNDEWPVSDSSLYCPFVRIWGSNGIKIVKESSKSMTRPESNKHWQRESNKILPTFVIKGLDLIGFLVIQSLRLVSEE